MTWLKHLLDKRERNTATRLPWHLTALIMEEYTRLQNRPEMMETILEDATAVSRSTASQTSPKPSQIARSRPTSYNSFGPSMARRLSYEGHVSFEPYIESTRTSLERESHRSGDGYLKAQSLPGIADSPQSSLYSSNPSILSNTNVHTRNDLGDSPSSSRLQIRDFANRIRRRPYGSDDGSSSARNSLSEDQSRSDDGIAKHRKVRRGPRPAEMAFTPAHTSDRDVEQASRSQPASEAGDTHNPNTDIPQTIKVRNVSLSEDGEPTAMIRSNIKSEMPADPSASSPLSLPNRKTARLSLPSGRVFEEEEEEHKRHRHLLEADEEKERHEYGMKAQCAYLVLPPVLN